MRKSNKTTTYIVQVKRTDEYEILMDGEFRDVAKITSNSGDEAIEKSAKALNLPMNEIYLTIPDFDWELRGLKEIA